MSTALAVLVGVIAVVIVVAAVVVMASWQVPDADQVLVVTGSRPRIVRRRGTFVWVGVARFARVDQALRTMAVEAAVISAEGIRFVADVGGSWRVGSDDESILATARHFVDRPALAGDQVAAVVTARVRAAVGDVSAGSLLEGSTASTLAATVTASAGAELAPLGLELVALHVTSIGDPTGYLADLARPLQARVASVARIAAARADADAVGAEQQSLQAQARAGVEGQTGVEGRHAGRAPVDGSAGVDGAASRAMT